MNVVESTEKDIQTRQGGQQDSLRDLVRKIGKGLGSKLFIYFIILVIIIAVLVWLYVQCILLMDAKSAYDKFIKFGLAPIVILALITVTALIYVDIYKHLRTEDEIIADITISGLKLEADKALNDNLTRLVKHKLNLNINDPKQRRFLNPFRSFRSKLNRARQEEIDNGTGYLNEDIDNEIYGFGE